MQLTPTSSTQPGYLPLTQTDDTFNHVDNSQGLQKDTSDIAGEEKKSPQSSVWKTTINLINYIEGVGFLALPYAMHRGGITAFIELVLMSFLMGYTASLLVDCLYEINEDGKKIRVRSSYQEIGFYCWPPFRLVISIILGISGTLTAVSYIVLFSSLMHQMYPGVPLTQSHWSCIATGIVLPTVFLEYLSKIAWLSLVGVFALVASVCLSLIYEFQEVHNWDVQSLLFWETQGVIIALNIVFFSYSLHLIIILVEDEMADRSKFKIALVSAFSVSAVIKVLFAVAGFLTYTAATNEVILNNLPAGLLTKIIATLFAANVLISYPLPTLVAVRILDDDESWLRQKLTDKIHPKFFYVLVRVGIVLLTLGAAVLFPHFALITSLDGCFNCSFAVLFPGIFHLRIKYEHLSWFQVFIDCFIIIFGIVCLSFGLVVAIKELI